jgi:hypothetical protein
VHVRSGAIRGCTSSRMSWQKIRIRWVFFRSNKQQRCILHKLWYISTMKSTPSSEKTSYVAIPVDDSYVDIKKPKKEDKNLLGFMSSCVTFSSHRVVLVLLLVGAALTVFHPFAHHQKSMRSKSESIDPMRQYHHAGTGMGPNHHAVVQPPPMVKNSSEDSEDSSDDSDDPMEWIGGMLSWFAGDSSDDSSDDKEHQRMGPPPLVPVHHQHMDPPHMDPDHHHHDMGPHHHTFLPPPMLYPFPKMDVIEKETMDSPDGNEDSLDSLDSKDEENSLDSEDSSDDSDDPWDWISKAWNWIVLDSSDDSADEFSNSTSED